MSDKNKKAPTEGDSAPLKKASAFRVELRDKGLGSDLIDRIVKSEVAAGKIEDDGSAGVLSAIPVDLLIESAKELETASATEQPKPDKIAKSEDFDDDALGRLSYVEAVAKAGASNGELLLEHQERVFPAILKSQRAVGMVLQGAVDALAHIASEIDELKKAVAEPIPPNGIAGNTGHLPMPADTALNKGENGKANPISAKVLRTHLMDLREDLIAKGESEKDILDCGAAIAALESGKPASAVIKQFKINFRAAS